MREGQFREKRRDSELFPREVLRRAFRTDFSTETGRPGSLRRRDRRPGRASGSPKFDENQAKNRRSRASEWRFSGPRCLGISSPNTGRRSSDHPACPGGRAEHRLLEGGAQSGGRAPRPARVPPRYLGDQAPSRSDALHAWPEVSARSGISSWSQPSHYSVAPFRDRVPGPFVGSQRIADGPGQRFLHDVHVLNVLIRRVGSFKVAHDRPPRSFAKGKRRRPPPPGPRVPTLPTGPSFDSFSSRLSGADDGGFSRIRVSTRNWGTRQGR